MRYTRLLRWGAVATPVTLVALSSMALPAAAQAQTPVAGDPPAVTQPPLTAAQAKALSANVTDKVIVLFKNQLADLTDAPNDAAARSAAVRSAQSGVLSQLAQTHALSVKSFSLINAVSATVSPGEAKYLAANPAVSEVVSDEPIPVAGDSPVGIARTAAAAAGVKPLPGACTSGKQVQLNPEAIENIHAATQSGKGDSAQALGYTGAGVKVAFIADGLNPGNPDFIRANGKHVFIDYQDFSGTGTHAPTDGAEAFLDASSIAAQGREVYNVAGYGVGLSTPCRIRILGVAPGASLVGLNVFGSANVAYNSVFLAAIDYAVSHDHVNVINESFGDNPFPDTASLDLVRIADDAAVKAGVTVTVSTGDAGPTNTIGSPATDSNVISAGATTTYRAYAQTGIGGITAPGVKGWVDNNISGLSSGGFDQNGSTVDVVAPGDLNWALCTPDPAKFAACTNFSGQPASVELQGGTSEAAPLTAGVAALVIQAYRKAHNGATPSPAVVKQIIVSTAQNINAPADQQGAGMIDAYQAVLAAASYHKSKPTGHAILVSPTQLNAVGQPGTTEHLAETLTNDGTGSVTVGLSSRTLSPYQPVSTKSLSLTNAASYATTVTFTVAKGQARLNASVALVGVVNLSLIAPDGDLAEYNLPQGVGNYGNAQVADPAPGKWTALISSGGSGAPLPAKFQASTATWQSFGTLSAQLGDAGARRLQQLHADRGDSRAGRRRGRLDHAAQLGQRPRFRSRRPRSRSRSAPWCRRCSTTFTGTLTGGNGRATSTGQTAYYQVEVPSGYQRAERQRRHRQRQQHAVRRTGRPERQFGLGRVQRPARHHGDRDDRGPARGRRPTARPPAPRGTVDAGHRLLQHGVGDRGRPAVHGHRQRHPGRRLCLRPARRRRAGRGHAGDRPVNVTNNGTTPEAYFVDARLNSQVKLGLAAQTTSTLTLPNVTGVVPEYLVPSHTTALKTTVSSSAPLYFDFSYPFGDPDLISTTGKTATGAYSAPDISATEWTVTPFLVGPTGAKAAKNVTATVSMTATTAGFDPAVKSPTGDLWLGSTNPAAPFTPYVVNPGQSVSIPVTITPAGKAGSTVTGTLYVADSSFTSGAVTYNELSGNLR